MVAQNLKKGDEINAGIGEKAEGKPRHAFNRTKLDKCIFQLWSGLKCVATGIPESLHCRKQGCRAHKNECLICEPAIWIVQKKAEGVKLHHQLNQMQSMHEKLCMQKLGAGLQTT